LSWFTSSSENLTINFWLWKTSQATKFWHIAFRTNIFRRQQCFGIKFSACIANIEYFIRSKTFQIILMGIFQTFSTLILLFFITQDNTRNKTTNTYQRNTAAITRWNLVNRTNLNIFTEQFLFFINVHLF
jgi:hypothetical protein